MFEIYFSKILSKLVVLSQLHAPYWIKWSVSQFVGLIFTHSLFSTSPHFGFGLLQNYHNFSSAFCKQKHHYACFAPVVRIQNGFL